MAETKQERIEKWNSALVSPKALFDRPDLALLCAKNIEGQYYERKSKRDPEKLAETICGFANSNREYGGLLAVGISDDGLLEGVCNRADININRLLEYHHYTGTTTQHRLLRCIGKDGRDDEILLIHVPYLENRVAETSNGKAFVRKGDKTIELRDADKRELEYTKGQISFEDEKACEFTSDIMVEEILEELRKSVVERDGARSDIPGTELLKNKGLIVISDGKKYLTKGGLLLIGKDPKACLPGAYVRLIRYEGREKKAGESHNVVKDETFSDPLPRLVQRLSEFMQSQFREFTFMGPDGKFVHEPEYPKVVWLEAIVNALVHRSYSQSNAPVFVEIYDDRIEVKSPGDYPAGVHPREFIHNPRNPHLMDGMRYLRFVRMLSEGSLRMREEMAKANLPEPFFSEPGNSYVQVVLRNDIDRRSKERADQKAKASEFANWFRITWQPTQVGEDHSEKNARAPERREIREALLKGLKAYGYAVDSFYGESVADIGNEYRVPELSGSQAVFLCPGFKFQIVNHSSGTYLMIDEEVHVRNRLKLDEILRIVPEVRKDALGKAFVRSEQKWVPARILNVSDSGEVSYSSWSDPAGRKVAPANDVLPLLSSDVMAQLIRKQGVPADLHKVVKRLSQGAPRDAARERASKTIEWARRLSESVFPLQIRNYELRLSSEPQHLGLPDLRVMSDLIDPDPVFGGETPGRARKVINGLSTYGSYQKPNHEITIVILCTDDQESRLRELFDIIQKGSGRYEGLERTFGISFSEPRIISVPTPHEYVNKCKEIRASISEDSVFLVYSPIGSYSRNDYASPYYTVKHYLLEQGFPSQMVDEETLSDPKYKDYNLALDIFAKAGFTPWVLAEGLPDADLFFGLSYSWLRGQGASHRLVGYVNVFDRYGRWQYYRGSTKPISFERRNRELGELVAQVVGEYQKKAKLQRLHIHHAFKLSRVDRDEMATVVLKEVPEAEISFVHINAHSLSRLYDREAAGDGSVARGMYLPVAPNRFYIATTGRNDMGQQGLGTPKPLDVTINRVHSKGKLDLRVYAQHILSLTRLNWASTKDFCREPITLKFAGEIAYLMNVFLVGSGEFKLHPRLERTPWFL